MCRYCVAVSQPSSHPVELKQHASALILVWKLISFVIFWENVYFHLFL